ncbi:uncharacterized protein LOC127724570 isoform X6 [Mytilus californianus]|uniref:uncharacterized protein LOC127724570 isoform X2 n=1 Tax=Mytilus californianus TaxID=6549 RepID=UPI0022457837|nr:uncharacterized protein LOC127724570 isoform X2 [Mytilus californianus]XP_052087521.1 uncharacterized protein LOC127724570 isoform X3 [Mytilus californianus]XP_052087522.1 uncharacterized protein LOC127724570 isoform X4 [Mytilus californianus]XP_052087523.1 uncharacterized protein LOC127724570 isoform X5 [Mytilus californianus]XP_052087524.1 uncharacterized protein LOC127724570 isoform X6 [Mytilus californianus]
MYVSGASCDNKQLIDHDFTNCKEITTEHREETSTLPQQQTSLIITSTEITTEHREETSTLPQQQTSLIITSTEITTEHREETSTLPQQQTSLIITSTEITTEHREETSTLPQQQTSLIITSTETTEAFPSFASTDNPASTTDSTTGIINTEVIIFISIGSGFFLILGSSVVCFCVHRRCKKANITRNVEIGRNIDNRAALENRNVEMNRNISTERGGDHEYTEINELEMSDFVASPSEQRPLSDDDTTSSDSSIGIRFISDGYLNPYQALLPAPQQPENIYEEPDEDSNPLEENRTYTNLYESLESNRREESHLYARCISEQSLEIKDEPI